MSAIYITDHDENIYDSTKKPMEYHKKSPRYVSKFRQSVKQEVTHVKRWSHATMGLPRRPHPSPTDFLKKQGGIRYIVPSLKKKSQEKRFPPVPKTKELIEEDKERIRNKPPQKNLVAENVKKALKLKTKEPVPKIAINRFGEVRPMSAGLEPVYIYSKVYGKTPAYLARVIKQRETQNQLKKDASGIEQPKCRYITRDERDTLLRGLKENWEDLQKTYQGLPILTDTIPKINRKTKLEADLKQLEKDIVLLERHPYIYVYDDDNTN